MKKLLFLIAVTLFTVSANSQTLISPSDTASINNLKLVVNQSGFVKTITTRDFLKFKMSFSDTASMLANYRSAINTNTAAFANYLPLAGGTLVGTSGGAFIGFIPQSSVPSAPTSGFRFYASSVGSLAWITSQNYQRELRVRSQTQNVIGYIQDKPSYTFGDSADAVNASNLSTGTVADARLSNNVSLLNRTEAYTGPKTFSPSFSASSGTTSTAGVTVSSVLNNTGSYVGTHTSLLINPTLTSITGTTVKLIDAQVAGTSKFSVDNSGIIKTFYDASNYTSFSTNSSGQLVIAPSGIVTLFGNSGADNYIKSGGSSTLNIQSGSGTIKFWALTVPSNDNSYDFGSSSLRWRSGYIGTDLTVPTIYGSPASGGDIAIKASSNAVNTGTIKTYNNIVSQTVGTSITSYQYKLAALNTAPASSTATGTLGEIRIDANYIYVCTATNTWVRSALTTW